MKPITIIGTIILAATVSAIALRRQPSAPRGEEMAAPSASAEDVSELRAEVAALRRDALVARLGQPAGAGGSGDRVTAGPGTKAPASSDAPPRETRLRLAKEGISRAAAALDLRLGHESVDVFRSGDALDTVRNAIVASGAKVEVSDATCTPTLCRVVLKGEGQIDVQSITADLGNRFPLDSTLVNRDRDADPPVVTLYALREGHGLKDVMETP